ncbi:MAG: Protoporphyrinogen IX oxidase, novel form, HemJ [uncultured Sphingomonas sp.]|uniref:Protoporphyrinogen IX oxidase n=1 Tax=uncultured Sphingomonas sp. TaxID=158754 RepID=A0A6J4SWI8_9SPHN|nr:MAG: Protoporphyrinogen IX oxidase, novel form, HemJ [uncultured Sphingomonas sp.]
MTDLAGFLGPAYLWVKAAHVTFVIFWMAGLFLLPRFYVYHQETAAGSPEDRAWIERESRVRSIILNPAMILVWGLGLALALHIDAFSQGWFHGKLALVVALSAYQGWLGAYGKKLASGVRPLSGKAVRMINEVPGIAAAIIVVLVIVRPF